MKLGIVVTDQAVVSHVLNVIDSAAERGWSIRCFLTDTGVRLLSDSGFRRRITDGNAQVAVCELSVERYGRDAESASSIPESVVVGGQYQDAELVHESDSVLVF